MLIALNDMKNYLGVGDASQDAFLTLQISLVSEAIEGYCQRKFSPGTYTQTFYLSDIQYTNQLPLYHFPLIGAPVLVEKDEEGNSFTVSDFRFHLGSGSIIKNFGRFFQNAKTIEATYTAGYTTLPALIQNVVYALVQERYNKKTSGVSLEFGSDVQRISIPGTISIDFDYSLNNNERKSHFGSILGVHLNVLDSYRSERVVVGSVAAYVV